MACLQQGVQVKYTSVEKTVIDESLSRPRTSHSLLLYGYPQIHHIKTNSMNLDIDGGVARHPASRALITVRPPRVYQHTSNPSHAPEGYHLHQVHSITSPYPAQLIFYPPNLELNRRANKPHATKNVSVHFLYCVATSIHTGSDAIT